MKTRFRHFKGIWYVKQVNDKKSEKAGHYIAIGGRRESVLILCCNDVKKHVYQRGEFDKENRCILSPTAKQPVLAIRREWIDGKWHLICGPFDAGHGSTGTPSWTAEDPGGWEGDKDDGESHG